MQHIIFTKEKEYVKIILAYSYLYEELTQPYYEYWDNYSVVQVEKPKDTIIKINNDFKSIIDTLLYFLKDKTIDKYTCTIEQSLIVRKLSMQLYYNYTNESIQINPIARDLIVFHEKQFGKDPSKYL